MEMNLSINQIICGDTLTTLKTFPAESIDCVITSPPYYGLRDYGIEGQIGLEKTPELYLEKMREIMLEIKRVLKAMGTIWWNMGDTYASSPVGNFTGGGKEFIGRDMRGIITSGKIDKIKASGLPPKCLLMMPERFALMCIQLGFILRNKIIWHKPNPMPSSVKDRFNTTWEYMFLFSKQRKYFFDLDAVRKPHKTNLPIVDKGTRGHGTVRDKNKPDPWGSLGYGTLGKNPGDFWSIITQPFPEAHFAVFPEKLCRVPIKAGCPKAICKKCGKARVKIFEKPNMSERPRRSVDSKTFIDNHLGFKDRSAGQKYQEWRNKNPDKFIGFTDCGCNSGFKTGIVLDPFCGAGTALVVAKKLGRNYIGIDLKPEYCKMARKRLQEVPKRLDKFPLENEVNG